MSETTTAQTGILDQKLGKQELLLCLCLSQARTVEVPMMAAACGFDAVYVDLEHTATSLETASMLCSAAVSSGLISMVRVPSRDPHLMTRALDSGAMGVIVPHVENETEAAELVRSCRFPPVGERSVSGANAVTGYAPMSPRETLEALERSTILAAMVESPGAVENADAIASVQGLDLLLVGSWDLTAELGILGRFDHERFTQAIRATAEACRKHRKVLGIAGISDVEVLRGLVELGVRFVSAGTDSGFFMQAARDHASRVRTLVSPGSGQRT